MLYTLLPSCSLLFLLPLLCLLFNLSLTSPSPPSPPSTPSPLPPLPLPLPPLPPLQYSGNGALDCYQCAPGKYYATVKVCLYTTLFTHLYSPAIHINTLHKYCMNTPYIHHIYTICTPYVHHMYVHYAYN